MSGDTVVVGAQLDDVGANADQGSAYVFVKPGGGWASATQTAKLTASDGAAGDRFGESVDVSGDTVVVGARWDDVGANADQGSAYVFVKPGGGWASGTQSAKLTASDGAVSDELGFSVDVSGDTIVAGAGFDDVGANADQGSAYVFVKPGGGWANGTQTAKLTASDGAAGDDFGRSVAVSGDTVVVGALQRQRRRERRPGFRVRLRQAGWRLGERNPDGEADRLGRSGERHPGHLRRRERGHGRRRGALGRRRRETGPGLRLRLRQAGRQAGRARPRRRS